MDSGEGWLIKAQILALLLATCVTTVTQVYGIQNYYYTPNIYTLGGKAD